MAGSSGLILLLDEVATMVKVAAQKTTTIAGVPAAKEPEQPADGRGPLSIILEVARGSLRNKAILAPAALAINFAMPWAVPPLLAAGGVFFAYEGMKKLKKLRQKDSAEEHGADAEPPIEGDTAEAARARKIKKAIRTDMILSGEIIAVTLAAVAALPLATQAIALGLVSLGATVGVYTVIAGIIKMEDLGGWLAERKGENTAAKAARGIGRALLAGKPHVMKGISVAGSAAIFMVGGGLIFHGIPALGHYVTETIATLGAAPYVHSLIKLGASFSAGLAVGAAAEPGINAVKNPVRRMARATWDHLVDFFWVPPARKPLPTPEPAPQPVPQEPAAAALPAPDALKSAFDTEAAVQPQKIIAAEPDTTPEIRRWDYKPQTPS